MTELQHRPRDQHEYQCGVAGEHHQVRRTAPQYRATEARFGVETDCVTDRRHGQCIGQQQRDQRQRMHGEAGGGDRNPSRNEPGESLHEGRTAARFGLGHGDSIEIVDLADGNQVLTSVD